MWQNEEIEDIFYLLNEHEISFKQAKQKIELSDADETDIEEAMEYLEEIELAEAEENDMMDYLSRNFSG